MSVPNGFRHGWQVALSLVTCFNRLFTTGERTALSELLSAFVAAAFRVAGRTVGVLIVVKGGCPPYSILLHNKIIYLYTLSDLQCMSKLRFFSLSLTRCTLQHSSRPTHISLNGFSTKKQTYSPAVYSKSFEWAVPDGAESPGDFFFPDPFFCLFIFILLFFC